MEIVYALLLGVAVGGVWALAALAMLLRVMKKSEAKAAEVGQAGEDTNRQATNMILKFHITKYALDVLLLLALFLGRGWLPFRWEFTLLGVAIMLTIFFQLLLACLGVNKRLGQR